MRRSDDNSTVQLVYWGCGCMFGALFVLLLTSCAIVNGSAYRVQPCPARSDTTATADSLRRHIGCFDTTDSTRKER